MCLDYLGNSIGDATTRCILQSLTGTPADALQDYTLYFMSIVLGIVLFIAVFAIFMLIAKVINRA